MRDDWRSDCRVAGDEPELRLRRQRHRTSFTQNGAARTYTTPATSNRLTSVSNPSRNLGYDAAGNTLTDTGQAYTTTYRLDNRMGTLTKNGVTLTYRYDAGGQRVHKEHSQGMRYFAYDLDGKMLGEYNATSPVHEFVWLGGMPVAVMTGSGPEPSILYVYADHLNAPRMLIDKAEALRWRWMSEPFGTATPEQAPAGLAQVVFNLRFPGQFFDSESGLYYNYFRDYDPTLGRYVQSDPVGIYAGINTFVYVNGAPLHFSDASGLDPWYRGPWEKPWEKFMPESREETMRRICAYAASPWEGHVPRDVDNWFDLNQRNAEHYYFGAELGRKMGPGAPVAIMAWEASKWARAPFGASTPPTKLGSEIGQLGAYDGWVRGLTHPESCECQKR
ncbi:RHS repeat domain-containing protein [Roseateles sp. L2-2]|uniref:RHS repeat domain-containing protein n=1 Tax=Roseateles sp. L2-2 TaxID=3422597 RepID=UPI003D3678A6